MKHGFSLVELSIVLVILGLLVGGILAGQSLIHASELRAVGTEYNRYKTATMGFRDKYLYLPGDLPNAIVFWGAADGGDGINSDCKNAETTNGNTCNGNGDGIIDFSPAYEYVRFWQQLGNAGLIEGKYIGTTSVTVCNAATPGCLYPASKFSGGLWTVWMDDVNTSSYVYNGNWGNILALSGDPTGGGASRLLNFLVAPEDAWNIDTKLDDGKPGTGRLIVSRRSYCDTGSGGTNTEAARLAAEYRLTLSGANCSLLFTKAF